MENETREVTYISIALILLALVLGFVVYGLGLIRSVSSNRNDEIIANDKLEQYREYNAYDGKTIYGDDVIELIRLKYDSGLAIFVDTRTNSKTSKVIGTSNRTCSYCNGENEDHRTFSYNMYLIHSKLSPELNYFRLETNAIDADSEDMRNWFPTDVKYRAYLVYDNQPPVEYYNSLISNYNVQRYAGYGAGEEGLLAALDSGVKEASASSNVTGIVLINYKTLGIT